MNPDFRALCAELIEALDGWHQAVLETGSGWVGPDETYLLDRARAALAEPERVAPKSIEERIAEADAAIEAIMKRIRKIIATPARQLAADRARAALAEPVGEKPTGDAAVEAAAELIYNQAMKWAATQPIPSDHINIPAWQQGGNSDAQEVARRTARAALAAKPLVKGPTDEELLATLDKATAAFPPRHPEGRESASVVSEPSDEELRAVWCDGWNTSKEWGALNFARAVLARFGNHSPDATKMVSDAYQMGRRDASADSQQAAEAAEGEVAELVAWLRGANWDSKRQTLATRAADLLEQFSSGWVVPTVEQFAPVPVSERLPEPEDCDAEGRCWFHLPDMGTEPLWRLTDPSMRSRYHSHWLPATALPLTTDAGQSPA